MTCCCFTTFTRLKTKTLIHLFNGGGGLKPVPTSLHLITQVVPLLLQNSGPLLDGSLVVSVLSGQILPSSQNSLVQRLLSLDLCLEQLK